MKSLLVGLIRQGNSATIDIGLCNMLDQQFWTLFAVLRYYTEIR